MDMLVELINSRKNELKNVAWRERNMFFEQNDIKYNFRTYRAVIFFAYIGQLLNFLLERFKACVVGK